MPQEGASMWEVGATAAPSDRQRDREREIMRALRVYILNSVHCSLPGMLRPPLWDVQLKKALSSPLPYYTKPR